MTIKQSIKFYIKMFAFRRMPVQWVMKGENSWLRNTFTGNSIKPPTSKYSRRIEALSHKTNNLGEQPLWEGYKGNNIGGQTRMPNLVRTSSVFGDLYTWLVKRLKPEVIVEFGTAFGVSGMYFTAGLNINGAGKLLTFEPNEIWAGLAHKNLSAISNRSVLTVGTFEDNIESVLPQDQQIDLAFIDAIHTKEFVLPQLDLVVARSHPKTIIILDDINFSESMRQCWNLVSTDERFAASLSVGGRIGLLEMR